MPTAVDTSVLVDLSRNDPGARAALTAASAEGSVHASEVVRAELLVGIRPGELAELTPLLELIRWHEVDREIAEAAGALGRRWLPSHRGISVADLIIAATALQLGASLLTRNVKHFPMFPGLERPY